MVHLDHLAAPYSLNQQLLLVFPTTITTKGHSLISYNKVQGTRVDCIGQKVKVKVKEELVSSVVEKSSLQKVGSEH